MMSSGRQHVHPVITPSRAIAKSINAQQDKNYGLL
jgi:hypothetical protein